MKRKFSMFLNIAMLALCVCAIAIGVYSAKTASLNVTGTVGFTAHNCDVDVSGYIYGHSKTADGTPVLEANKVALTTKQIRGENATLELGTIYFSDMTESGEINPITLTLNFENLSDFDVKVNITPKTIDGITITPDKTSLILSNKSATEAEKKKTVTVTLTCASTSTGITPANKQILQINMAKYTAPPLEVSTASDFFWNNVSTNTRSYVTMGKYNEKALRWYIFAQGNTEDSMTAVTGAVETNADNTLKAGTYWFISEYVLYRDTGMIGGVNFDDSSNVYGTSDIKAYLDGTGTGTFAETYGITEEDAVYSKIDARTLPAEEKNGDVEAFTEVADQKLWLLSVSELKYLNNGTACNPNSTYSTLIAQNISSDKCYWWLRSPGSFDEGGGPMIPVANVFSIGHSGIVIETDAISGIPDSGARPAFQITIAG